MLETFIGILIIILAIIFILVLVWCCCRKCKARHSRGGGHHGPNIPVIYEPHPHHYGPSKYDIETGHHPHAYVPAPPPLLQDGGSALSWSVAMKRNGNPNNQTPSSKAWYVSAGNNIMNQTEDIMDWIHHILDSQQWDGFFAYNDQPPGYDKQPSSRGSGHCKGIVAWNSRYLGWMVHSVPKWPEGRYVSLSRANYSFPPIETSQLIFAQSFAWVVMPVSARSSIINQLDEMQAFVYYSSPHTIWPYRVGEEIGAQANNVRSVPRTLPLGSQVTHIAKNGAWDACIYHDFLGTGLGKGRPMYWRVQTWSKQDDLRGLQFCYVMDVRQLRFPDNKNPIKNRTSHSKWAISHEPHHALVFIGDLNRALSQNKRGGGGILIQSRVLWNFMDDLCVSYFQNGISYEQ